MKPLALMLFVPTIVCAQEVDWDVPQAVFTLPQPKNHKLTPEIKNLIMFCLSSCPDRAEVWRDEYRAIFEDRTALISWLKKPVMDVVVLNVNQVFDGATGKRAALGDAMVGTLLLKQRQLKP